MPVEIGRALREGIERTASRDGLTFTAFAYALAVLGWAVVGYVPWPGPLPGGQAGLPGPGSSEPALDLPLAATGVAFVVLLLVAVAVMAAALRTFAAGDGERLALGRFTRNYPRMVANLAAGSVVQAALVGGLWALAAVVGFLGITVGLSAGGWGYVGLLVAVVVVGLLAATALVALEAFYFWYVFVVVEDRGFVDAFRRSWAAVDGNRPSLFVLGVLVWIVNTVVTGAAFVPAFLLPSPAAFLVGQAGSALATVFTLATTARTWVQLVAGEEDEADTREERDREPGRTPAREPELETGRRQTRSR